MEWGTPEKRILTEDRDRTPFKISMKPKTKGLYYTHTHTQSYKTLEYVKSGSKS